MREGGGKRWTKLFRVETLALLGNDTANETSGPWLWHVLGQDVMAFQRAHGKTGQVGRVSHREMDGTRVACRRHDDTLDSLVDAVTDMDAVARATAGQADVLHTSITITHAGFAGAQ